ncbi:efflux RND transporter periplasmic adaptor subunit [Serpentinicella alkaliphila]|uniref:RND family efflux transporter MFP subunit n=1 Tax=Serpentinicella alkaliphila TaxID=1734049 RepID=A0A4R2TXT8_9FIRM|nr:efflux RND transporter periplasmic adaptor subunit [Serpentinicella alkaliphila]TCQ02489.1 RND family efflux transporter MFP subunit [Serpentinicella alkaliphila]
MKRTVIYIIVVIVLIGAVLTTRNLSKKNNVVQETVTEKVAYVPVEVESIKKDTIGKEISLNGKVFANEEVMVIPQMPGTVVSKNVNLGDYVRKGDVLFVLKQDDILRSIEQASNSLQTAKIQYETTRERYLDALLALERTKSLYEAGAVSKSQLEQAEMAASDKSLQTAEIQVRQAEKAYDQASSALDNTLVIAPISGVISSLSAIESQLVSSAQPVATIIDIDKVSLQFDVAENMINRLYIGQEVTVDIPSSLEGELKGKIDFISTAADARTQLYKVKVNITNKDHRIKPGMSGSIKFNIESRQDVLVVRSRAIIDSEGEKLVYVVEDEKAVQKEVVLGLDTGLYIEVKEGLKEGDVVIIKGQQYVVEGQSVKVVRGE